MPKEVNYPVYVPASCSEAAILIATGKTGEAIALIERKTALGDPAAAALLGYLNLRGAIPDPQPELINHHLRRAADGGDPYAEFVLALSLRALNVPNAAARWMTKSACQVFPPAQAHLGRYMTHGIGFNEPNRKTALDMYVLALKHGHIPSLGFIADWLRTSRYVVVRALGHAMFPLVSMVVAIQIAIAPFDVRSFVHLHDGERPLFTKPNI
jgi:hypothetical protein